MSRLTSAALAALVLTASGAAAQHAPAVEVPKGIRKHLGGERFEPVPTVAALPETVKDGLKTLFRADTLYLADPGAEFQHTDVIVNPNLPGRRLSRAGCSADHCLLYWERGGIAHTRYIALFRLAGGAATFECGGTAPAGLGTLDDVRAALFKGRVVSTEHW